jgi:hypothetical protein
MRPYLRDLAFFGALGWDQFWSWALDRSAAWARCHSRQHSEHSAILEFQTPLEMADESNQRSCSRFIDGPSRDGPPRRHRMIGDLVVVGSRQPDCNCGIVRRGVLGATSPRRRGSARAHCLC